MFRCPLLSQLDHSGGTGGGPGLTGDGSLLDALNDHLHRAHVLKDGSRTFRSEEETRNHFWEIQVSVNVG